MIAFHDTVEGPFQNTGEVHKFWKGIKEKYSNYWEIVKDWN